MRIGFAVSDLGRGGAELQLLRLATGLHARGHTVHVVAYAGAGPLDESFRSAGIDVSTSAGTTRASKRAIIGAWLRDHRFDVVHAVMWRASTLVLLARGIARRPVVVASEFSAAAYGSRGVAFRTALLAFAAAGAVITETDVNRRALTRLAPWLWRRVRVIRNGVDTAQFHPRVSAVDEGPFTFCAVGTLSRVKNPLRLIDAVLLLRERGRTGFRVDWYGRDSLVPQRDAGRAARAAVLEHGLQDVITFHGDTPSIEKAYRRADALIHPSVHEGFPNAVVEAMASGLPVLVGRVGDLPETVDEAHNGFVFDQYDPSSVADAMERMMVTSAGDRRAMGERSRAAAERMFGLERFLDEHERLYLEVTERRLRL